MAFIFFVVLGLLSRSQEKWQLSEECLLKVTREVLFQCTTIVQSEGSSSDFLLNCLCKRTGQLDLLYVTKDLAMVEL